MRLSIRARVFLAVVLIQLVSGTAIVGWYFYTVYSDLRALSRESAAEAVGSAIASTDRYFAPAEEIAHTVERLLATDVLDRNEPGRIERFFHEQLRRAPAVDGVYVGYPNGDFFYVMRSDEKTAGGTRTKLIRHDGGNKTVDLIWRDEDFTEVETAQTPDDPYDPRSRSWYKAATEKHGFVWTDPYVFFTTRHPGVTAAVPVLDTDGTVAAVVGVDIEIGGISEFLRQIGFRTAGTAFIVTSAGNVIAHSRIAQLLSQGSGDGAGLRFRKAAELTGVDGVAGKAAISSNGVAADTGSTSVREESFDGSDYFVALGDIAGTGRPWRVVSIVPATPFVGVLHASNLLLIGIVVLVTALACVVGYVVASNVGRAIADLHRNAKLARNGNIELMEPIESGFAEIDETAEILHTITEQRRHRG